MEDGWKLKVVTRSHALVLDIYRATESFPRHELYGLTSQIRRAAQSVPMNLVEGAKRRSQVEYARFINIAQASLAEVQYQLRLAQDLGFISTEHALAMRREADEIARMIFALWRAVMTTTRKVR